MIKDYSSREDGAMGRRIDPLLSYFSFQPMHHDWYELSSPWDIKDPLLLIRKNSPYNSGFLLII